jgi:hypothetical protein
MPAPVDDESSFECPFCKNPCSASALRCDACQRKLPWAIHLEQLGNELKEREPNRVRATFTFLKEAFDHIQGTGRISPSAIKGLIASWIMPRTVIVVGGLLGGGALIIQTAILYQQTKLLERQDAISRRQREIEYKKNILLLTNAKNRMHEISNELKVGRKIFCYFECEKNIYLMLPSRNSGTNKIDDLRVGLEAMFFDHAKTITELELGNPSTDRIIDFGRDVRDVKLGSLTPKVDLSQLNQVAESCNISNHYLRRVSTQLNSGRSIEGFLAYSIYGESELKAVGYAHALSAAMYQKGIVKELPNAMKTNLKDFIITGDNISDLITREREISASAFEKMEKMCENEIKEYMDIYKKGE